MEYKHARIMLIDLPGIIRGASEGKGFGKRILSVAKTADLILIMLDIWNLPHMQYRMILKELHAIGIRLDRFPPLISISKLKSGGISLNSTVPLSHLDTDLARSIMKEFRIINAQIIARNCAYIPSIIICNKMDISTPEQEKFLQELEAEGRHIIRISAETGMNLDLLKEEIFHKLDLIRIYLKPKGAKADLIEPLVVPRDSKVRYVAEKLHRDFVDRFRYAFVQHATKNEHDVFPIVEKRKWKVGLEHVLQDYDVLQINIK